MKKGTIMKKIGLVGGTGPESTLMYYKEVNYSVTSNRASEQEARHCLPSTGLMYDYRPYSLSIRA